jgi:exosome complex component RRP4
VSSGHGTYLPPSSLSITSSVAGTLTRTNKLLSIRPLRARYSPEVGDLIVGRVIEVQAKRWKVDVGASQLALLPLSAINLPGGVLRRRTETDELQIRNFFAEGDVLVAEVQQLYQDGAAVLHARSLRYGKLRNGIFVSVSGGGAGGGAGVVRARRQVWNFEAANGGGGIEVVLGVNGYVWICKHVEAASATAGEGALGGAGGDAASSSSAGVGARPAGAGLTGGAGAVGMSAGITNMEEGVSATMYASQNDKIEVETMREIARVRGVITALVQHGLKVDEDMVMKGYQEAVEMALENPADVYLGGERGKSLAAVLSD